MPCPECYEYIGKIKKLQKEIERLKQVDVKGWQGKDKLSITKMDTDWHITEHRKDKESGEVAQQTHIIPEINVANIWEIIKGRAKIVGEKTRYREVVADIILKKHLPISIDEFNGGFNRSKYLFLLYYYPIKVLEAKGFVRYGGRGTIVRIKE